MTTEQPELTTVTSKSQVTIPSGLRKQFDLQEGDRLMAVPTGHGIVLKKVELPSGHCLVKHLLGWRSSVERLVRPLEIIVVAEGSEPTRSAG